MRPRSAALLVSAVAALATSAAQASAAEIHVNRSCFADPADRRDTVVLTGSGFTPDATYQVTLDGQPLAGGTGHTDAAGGISGRFVAPRIASVSRIAHQHRFVLGVQEGATQAATSFTVSRLLASFAPAKGAPRSLRVRFSVFGFSLQGARRPPVFVHYVGPTGHLARTVRLGTAGERCGTLRTKRRRLFGFVPRRGAWRLQFDTRKRYTRGSRRSSFLYFTVGVDVR